jgi:hypothetical protein
MTTGPFYNNPGSQNARSLRTGYRESSAMPQRVRDVLGRLKVSVHQNIYEADFEYGTQPLRWEQLVGNVSGNTSIAAVPSSGGVRMRVGTSLGDYTIRQSRPYHRYQPGKTMFMATGVNFGTALAGNVQRMGFFDDSNGVFFEQSVTTPTNPFGIYAVVRTDVGGNVQETRIGIDQWNGDQNVASQINFQNIQMFWIEYGWYGAGATRWGFWIDGEPVIGHQIGWGNYNNTVLGTGGQQGPWSRTGNLPVRYEQRNLTATTAINDMYHYGVSVIVEGGQDGQRGFTYSYGLPNTVQTRQIGAGVSRFPLLTVRGRQLGTQEYGSVYANSSAANFANVSSIQTSNSIFYGNITGNILTVNATTTGSVALGQQINGFGVPQGTYIVSGTGTTYTLSTGTPSTSISNIIMTGNTTIANFTGTPFSNTAGAANNYIGRTLFFPNQGSNGNGIIARIINSNSSALFLSDVITGGTLTSTPSVSTTRSPTGTGGSSGSNYFTVSSPTGITAGMSVIGTNIPNGTLVSNIAGSVVTINQPLTGALSSTQLQFVTGYCIGLVNRGQLLPKRLMVSSDNRCVVELISGSVVNTPVITGNVLNFTPMNTIGSNYSFAERDYNATGTINGGEVVFAFTLAAGSGLQDIDLSYFFPLYTNIRGDQIDTLTLAITTPSVLGANVGGHLICQEAMS